MPARFLLLRTKAAKERLRPALAPGNVQKTMSAPVTVIVADDLRFYEKLPKLAPHNRFRDLCANNPELAEVTAKRNSTLQGAYRLSRLAPSDWTAVQCRDLITPRSMEEFFGTGVEREGMCAEYIPGTIKSSFATSVMATRHRCAPVRRA